MSKRRRNAKAPLTETPSDSASAHRVLVALSSLLAKPTGRRSMPELRRLCANLYDDSGIARGVVDKFCDSVIGKGWDIQPKLNAEFLGIAPETAQKIQRRIRFYWQMWAEDVGGQCSFDEVLTRSFKLAAINGDHWVQPYRVPDPTFSLRLNQISGDSVRGGSGTGVVDGVKVGLEGPEAFFYPAASGVTGQFAYSDIIHYSPNPISANRRSMPLLAIGYDLLYRLLNYIEVEQGRMEMSQLLTFFVSSPHAGASSAMAEAARGAMGRNAQPSFDDRFSDKKMKQLVHQLYKEEDVKVVTPDIPKANITAFFDTIIDLLGIGYGMPGQVIRSSYAGSYSAARAALFDYWNAVERHRMRIWPVARRVYRHWLDEVVLRGYVDAPSDYFFDPAKRAAFSGLEFEVGSQPNPVDPNKAAQRAKVLLDQGLTTRQNESFVQSGLDWSEVVQQAAHERRVMIDNGLLAEAATK